MSLAKVPVVEIIDRVVHARGPESIVIES